MTPSEKVKFISNWIKTYVDKMPNKAQSLVIGISGGIDSSVSSTLSAMTGIKTIVLMTDTPLMYGSYNKYMHAIIPDGEKTVTHNTRGKNKINPKKIFNKFIKLIK